MRKGTNKPSDVFSHMDMRSGDTSQCWPWLDALNSKGLPYFSIAGKKKLAYRVSHYCVTGDLGDDDPRVGRHTCDSAGCAPRVCCNPYHIVPGTQTENMIDMKTRNRHGQNAHVVRSIRKLVAAGRTHEFVADLYGIGRQTVTDIVNEVTHSHVEDENA